MTVLRPALSRRVVVVLAFALTLAPIAVFPLGIGRDYPNHLARIYIQANIGSDPDLQANYDVIWRIVPHSALSAVEWLAASGHAVLGGQLFIAATLGLVLLGSLTIHRALFGQVSLWPLVAVFAMFNLLLEWGFVEYLFSVGLALNAFALWIVSSSWSPTRRVPLFSVLALAMFWSHVLGFLLFGLLISSFELGRVLDRRPRLWRAALREWAWASIQFAVPLALLAYVAVAAEDTGNGMTAFGGLRERVVAVLSPTSFHGDRLALAIGGFFAVVVVVGWRFKWLEWDARMRWPLAGLVVVSALMPVSLLGIWGVHFRYPVVLMLLLIATARVRTPPAVVRRGFVVAFLGVLAIQQANVWSEMYRVDSLQGEVQTAVRAIEPGAAMMIGGERSAWLDVRQVDGLAVLERSAFVPGLFSDITRVQTSESRQRLDGSGPPLSRNDLAEGAARAPASEMGEDRARRYWYGWPQTFDYLLWIHGGETGSAPAPGLRWIAGGAKFDLYAIDRTVAASSAQR